RWGIFSAKSGYFYYAIHRLSIMNGLKGRGVGNIWVRYIKYPNNAIATFKEPATIYIFTKQKVLSILFIYFTNIIEQNKILHHMHKFDYLNLVH
ncbi:hypothetical protein, partial [Lacrimispora sp.]|uniref:hypothetical protein n=1 Tax=Lacrimispora sp. TaxID=2719234 RepID=UPI002FD88AA0